MDISSITLQQCETSEVWAILIESGGVNLHESIKQQPGRAIKMLYASWLIKCDMRSSVMRQNRSMFEGYMLREKNIDFIASIYQKIAGGAAFSVCDIEILVAVLGKNWYGDISLHGFETSEKGIELARVFVANLVSRYSNKGDVGYKHKGVFMRQEDMLSSDTLFLKNTHLLFSPISHSKVLMDMFNKALSSSQLESIGLILERDNRELLQHVMGDLLLNWKLAKKCIFLVPKRNINKWFFTGDQPREWRRHTKTVLASVDYEFGWVVEQTKSLQPEYWTHIPMFLRKRPSESILRRGRPPRIEKDKGSRKTYSANEHIFGGHLFTKMISPGMEWDMNQKHLFQVMRGKISGDTGEEYEVSLTIVKDAGFEILSADEMLKSLTSR